MTGGPVQAEDVALERDVRDLGQGLRTLVRALMRTPDQDPAVKRAALELDHRLSSMEARLLARQLERPGQ